MTKPPANLRQTGCAIALTAAVALPAGFWLAGTMRPAPAERPIDRRASPAAEPGARDVYSADIRGDPYVLARQRALVEAMERACRLDPATCPQARAARRYLDARAAVAD